MVLELGKPAPDLEVLRVLKDLAQEHNTQPHTPELVNRFWRIFLETSIKSQGLDIPVPTIKCDRTSEELEALRKGKEGRMWIPETGLTKSQLDRIFPAMKSDAVWEARPIRDEFEQDAKGVDVEVSIDSPYTITTEKGLKGLFESQGRKGMRPSTYILTSQASKLLTNRHLDEGDTWSRLLDPRGGGGFIGAKFHSDGRLSIYWIVDPQVQNSDLGGRSEGVKKT